jgi:hypothetical protein
MELPKGWRWRQPTPIPPNRGGIEANSSKALGKIWKRTSLLVHEYESVFEDEEKLAISIVTQVLNAALRFVGLTLPIT